MLRLVTRPGAGSRRRWTYPHDDDFNADRPAECDLVIAWMLTGAGYALGILGALSIGPYILVITVAATIVLATHTGSRVGLPGLISGLSLPLFYVGS